jgi:hypothetical protein
VGVGNPAEETYRYPNQIVISAHKLELGKDLSISITGRSRLKIQRFSATLFNLLCPA